MNTIPPFDLSEQYRLIGAEIQAAANEVLASGRYIGGATVETFEQHFAAYMGTAACVACNSGTDALYLALRALDIGPGDEIITSPFTFIATAEAISAVGATPVFVDIEPHTFNLDLAAVEAALSHHTRAILPVHLFGQAVDMTRLMALAATHQLTIVEDCAQATGAQWAGQKVGSIGHMGCFSFYPTKNLGACGDGGAVTTDDPAIAARIKCLRDHGRRGSYYYEELGVNSRLDAVQAAILSVKLRHLDTWNQQRHIVAERYRERLAPIADIQLPQAQPHSHMVWNQYTIRIPDRPNTPSTEPSRRDRVRDQLREQGVIAMVYYPLPLHLQPAYASLGYQPGQLPQAEQAAREVLSLPMFPELSAEQQDRVVYTLKDVLATVA